MAADTAAAVLYTRAEIDARAFWSEANKINKQVNAMMKQVIKVSIKLDTGSGTAAINKQVQQMMSGFQKQAQKYLEFKPRIDTKGAAKDVDSLEKSVLRSGVKMRQALGQIRLKIPSSDVDSARRQVDGLGSSFGGLRNLILGVFGGNLLTQGFGQLTSMVKEAAFGFNSMVEQARIGFTQFLGTTAAADKLLNTLKDFANVTPFELKGLIPMAQQMLATGTALKDLIPNMRAIGDAVSAMGGSQEVLEGVQRALGQIATKGRVQSEELLQLSERGIQAQKYLAQGLGVSQAGLTKLMQKGAVDSKTAIKALLDGMKRDFGGMMAEQAKTFQGSMSTIKDSITRFAADAFKPIFTEVSAFGYEVGQVISASDFQSWGKTIGESVARGVEIAKTAFRAMSDFAQSNKAIVVAAIGAMLLAYTGLATAIRAHPLVATLAFIQACGALRDRTDAIGAAARAATPVLYGLAAALTAIQVASAVKSLPELGAKMLGFTAAAGGGGSAAMSAAAKFKEMAETFGTVKTAAVDAAVFVKAAGLTFANLNFAVAFTTASITPLAFAIASVVAVLATLAIGLAAIGWQKYNEKAAIAAAMNRDVEVSAARMGKAVTSAVGAAQWGKSASAIKSVTALKTAFDSIKNSADGLKKFQAQLAKTKSVVNFGAKFDTPAAKELMQLQIKQLQRQAEDHAVKIQLKVEADKASMEAASITTFGFIGEAFQQQWGGAMETMSLMWQGALDAMIAPWNAYMWLLRTTWTGVADLVTGFFGDLDAISGGWISRFSSGVSEMWDSFKKKAGVAIDGVKGFFGFLGGTVTETFSGTTANQGETDGPSLPAGVAARPKQTAAQKAQATAEQRRIKVLEKQLADWQAKQKTGPAAVTGGEVDKEANKRLQKELAASQKSWESYASTIEGLKGQMDGFGKQSVETATRAKLIAEGFDRISPAGFKVATAMGAIVDKMKAMDELQGGVANLIQGMEDQMFGLGSNADPFYKAAASVRDLVENSLKFKETWKQGTNLAIKGLGQAGTQLDRIEAKLDALSATASGGASGAGTPISSSATGMAIAKSAERIQDQYGNRIGSAFARSCDRLADLAVKSATKDFDRFVGKGPGKASAAQTMAGFKNAGVGFAPGRDYKPTPGDLVYTGASVGRGAGHAQVVGVDGRYLDQYGRHATPKTAPEWVVRAGGAQVAGSAAVAGSGAAGGASEASQLREMSDRARAMKVPVSFEKEFLRNNEAKWKNAPRDNGNNQNLRDAHKYLASNVFTKAAKEAGLTTKEVTRLGAALIYTGKATDWSLYLEKGRVATKALSDETRKITEDKTREFRVLRQTADMYRHGAVTMEQLEVMTQRVGIEAEVMGDKQVKAADKTKAVNDRLWATMRNIRQEWQTNALANFNTEIQELDKSYAALRDSTIGAIAQRQLEADATYKHLPALQKEILLRARVRNEIAASIQAMAKETQARARSMQQSRDSEKNRNPLDALNQQYRQQDAEQRRSGAFTKVLPDDWWKAPEKFTTLFKDVPMMMQLARDRAWEVGETLKDWNISSFKETSQAVLDLMQSQLLTTEQIVALQASIATGIASGKLKPSANLTPGQLTGLQDKAAKDSFGSEFNLGDIQKRADDATAALSSRRFEEAVQKGLVDPVRQAQIQMDDALKKMDEWAAQQDVTGATLGILTPEMEKYTQAWREYVDAVSATTTMDHQKAFEDQIKPLRDRAVQLNSPFTSQEQQYSEMKTKLKEQRFTDPEIDEIMNLQRWLDDTEKFRGALYGFRDSMSGIFNEAFGKIYDEGFKGFFSNIIDGVGKMLNQIASQIITSYAMKGLMGLLGVKTGGDGQMSGGGGFLGGMFGAIFGGGKNPGSIAPSVGASLPENYSPVYPGESVMEASASTARVARRSVTQSSTFGAGVGGSSVVSTGQNVAVYGDVHVTADNPQEFGEQVAAKTSGPSRGEQSKEGARLVSRGRSLQ